MKPKLNKNRHFNEPGSKTEPVLRKNSDDKNNWFLEKTGEIYNRFEELQEKAEANTLPMLIEAVNNGFREIPTLNKENEEPINLEEMPVTEAQRQAKADKMLAQINEKITELKAQEKKIAALRAAQEAKLSETTQNEKEKLKKQEPEQKED